jgi:hypothetical protein
MPDGCRQRAAAPHTTPPIKWLRTDSTSKARKIFWGYMQWATRGKVGPTTSFLAKYCNEASVANCEDNFATIFLLKL